jgi:hypothetical protein
VVNDGSDDVVIAINDDNEWEAVVKDKQAASEGNSLQLNKIISDLFPRPRAQFFFCWVIYRRVTREVVK